MSDDIQPADRAYRLRVIIILAIALLLALLAWHFTQRWLQAHALLLSPHEAARQLRFWTGVLATLCGFCLLALAVHAWRRSQRAAREQRWPLSGVRVVRSVRIRRGDAVMPIVRMLRMATAMLVIVAAAAIGVGWQLHHALP